MTSVETMPDESGRGVPGRRKIEWGNKVPPLVTALLLLLIWQFGFVLFGVPSYVAPAPSVVITEFVNQFPILLSNFWPTFFEALAGFALGNGIAIAIAVLLVHSQLAERCFYPLAVFIHSIPILALAPILVLLLGTGYAPKIVIAGLICFFPTLVNMVRGLRAVNPQAFELMRVLSANPSEVFWKLRVPSSLPFLFAALKVAAPACVIGAVVGEWIGSSVGLGALILEATFNFRAPLLYATIFISSGLAICLFSIVSVVESRTIRWQTGQVY